jgi:hypothetical protein
MYKPKQQANQVYTSITIGTVVDTNDPQQTGRLRILVPAYGDRSDSLLKDIPWASYIAPFGGVLNNDNATRGTEQKTSQGPVAYGMFNIPKVGAAVAVTCIDGDPMARIWLGCLQSEMLGHTLPHGRFMLSDGSEPDGPLSSQEHPIQPLYDNLTNAFSTRTHNYEWRTRGADYSTCAVNPHQHNIISSKADDVDISFTAQDGNTTIIRQGYAKNQTAGNNNVGYDPQVYSWTSPGFHSISMDDRKENCRVKLRTSAGHQILLDDTNERIYINTAEGRNWIELDQDGNIDIYATKRVSVRSESDINLTSDKTVRLYGNEGIHMYSGGEIRLQSVGDTHMKIGGILHTHSSGNTNIQSDADVNIKAGSSIFVDAGSEFNIMSGAAGKITSGGTLNLTGSEILETGSQIHLNGPTASTAAAASDAGELVSFWTNKLPSHEPYGRCITANDFTHDPKYKYDDPQMGRDDKIRNEYWRR